LFGRRACHTDLSTERSPVIGLTPAKRRERRVDA
jgi:hypothetical protein